LLAQQHPIVVKDFTMVRDTMTVSGSITVADTVAVQDTLLAQDTLTAQSVVVPETVAAQDTVVLIDSLVVQDTVVVLSDATNIDVPLAGRLFHEPPAKGILNDRPFLVHLFVNIDSIQVLNVSLNLKNDSSQVYREYHMSGAYGRYGFRLPVEDLVGSQLEYYFLVELRDYGLLAYPQDTAGAYLPFQIPLVIPTQEYFQRP
jgi:hypothetical protein